MLYLTCTTIFSVDLAQYGVSLAKDWVSVECGTMKRCSKISLKVESRWVRLEKRKQIKVKILLLCDSPNNG